MGLDTQIRGIIKFKKNVEFDNGNTQWVEDKLEIDVAYFRKCWSLAMKLHDLMEGQFKDRITMDYEDDWTLKATPDVIQALLEICAKEYKDVLNGERFDGIWVTGVYLNILSRAIHNLTLFYAFTQKKLGLSDFVEGCSECGEKEIATIESINYEDLKYIDYGEIKINAYNSY